MLIQVTELHLKLGSIAAISSAAKRASSRVSILGGPAVTVVRLPASDIPGIIVTRKLGGNNLNNPSLIIVTS